MACLVLIRLCLTDKPRFTWRVSVVSPISAFQRSLKIRVLMRIGWCATTEKLQGFRGTDLMPGSGRDEDGITWANGLSGAIDFHKSMAGQDIIKLLAEVVIVAFRGSPWRQCRFRQALVCDRGVAFI